MFEIDREKCDLCGTCMSVCSYDAIDIAPGSMDINENCTECNLCVEACPTSAIYTGETQKAEKRKREIRVGAASKLDYDIAVVGAGPGGSIAAHTAAEKGLNVILLERNEEIGVPVRCAEGASQAELNKFFKPDEKWICARVKGANVHAPDLTKIVVKEEGYILERTVFDKFLAKNAVRAGAEVITRATATGLIKEDTRVSGIHASVEGENYEINAKIVIGADGIGSRVGRWAGIDTTLHPRDIVACAEFLIADVDVDGEYCEIYLSNEIAPGGYAWIFPKGRRRANVGLGILASRAQGAIDYLRRFAGEKFPDGKVVKTIIGGVPVSAPIERTVADGLILVGDAARQTEPLSGAGIINAMQAGKMAGEVAANAIREGDVSTARLGEYEGKWRSTIGEMNEKLYRVQELLVNMSDGDLNDTAHRHAERRLGVGDVFGLIGRVV